MSKSTQKGIFFSVACAFQLEQSIIHQCHFFFQNSPSKKVKMWRVNFKNGFVVEIDSIIMDFGCQIRE